jgi:hypothetical protein
VAANDGGRVCLEFHFYCWISDLYFLFLITLLISRLTVTVTRLIRTSYGDYQLQTIPPGMALEVPFKPIKQQTHRGQLFKRKKKVVGKDTEPAESSAVPVEWVRNV